MYEIYNNLAKVQNTAAKVKETKRKQHTDMTSAWQSVNPDRNNLIHFFGGSFRIASRKF